MIKYIIITKLKNDSSMFNSSIDKNIIFGAENYERVAVIGRQQRRKAVIDGRFDVVVLRSGTEREWNDRGN